MEQVPTNKPVGKDHHEGSHGISIMSGSVGREREREREKFECGVSWLRSCVEKAMSARESTNNFLSATPQKPTQKGEGMDGLSFFSFGVSLA